MALGRLGPFDDAVADLNFALSISPDFQPARLSRGAVYLLQGRRNAALADFTAVLQARLSAAAFYRERALHENPADLHTRLNCAWADDQNRGDNFQAHEQFTRPAAIDPTSAEAHAGPADIAACTGRADDARAEGRKPALQCRRLHR